MGSEGNGPTSDDAEPVSGDEARSERWEEVVAVVKKHWGWFAASFGGVAVALGLVAAGLTIFGDDGSVGQPPEVGTTTTTAGPDSSTTTSTVPVTTTTTSTVPVTTTTTSTVPVTTTTTTSTTSTTLPVEFRLSALAVAEQDKMNRIDRSGPFIIRDRSEFSDGVAFDPGGRFQATASWDLPAELRCFIASVGAERDTKSDAVFALSVADADEYVQSGRIREPAITVRGAEQTQWIVDVTGVLRLHLNVEQTDSDAITSPDWIVLGDARLTGAPCPS